VPTQYLPHAQPKKINIYFQYAGILFSLVLFLVWFLPNFFFSSFLHHFSGDIIFIQQMTSVRSIHNKLASVNKLTKQLLKIRVLCRFNFNSVQFKIIQDIYIPLKANENAFLSNKCRKLLFEAFLSLLKSKFQKRRENSYCKKTVFLLRTLPYVFTSGINLGL